MSSYQQKISIDRGGSRRERGNNRVLGMRVSLITVRTITIGWRWKGEKRRNSRKRGYNNKQSCIKAANNKNNNSNQPPLTITQPSPRHQPLHTNCQPSSNNHTYPFTAPSQSLHLPNNQPNRNSPQPIATNNKHRTYPQQIKLIYEIDQFIEIIFPFYYAIYGIE